MTPLSFILQKTKALKEARDAADTEIVRSPYGGFAYRGKDGGLVNLADMNRRYSKHVECEELLFLAATTRFADALEVVVKALDEISDMSYQEREEDAHHLAALAIEKAAGILRGGSE